METLDLLVAGTCAVFAHAMIRLWRNRHAPGAIPCLLLFAAVSAYVLTALLRQPSALALQAGYVGGVLITPLLFTAAAEFTEWPWRGWKVLRWMAAPAVAVLAVVNLMADEQGLMAAIAHEPDLVARSSRILEARHNLSLPTSWCSYGFAAMTAMLACWKLSTGRSQRREMVTLLLLPPLVALVDGAYYVTGFTLAGAAPTPFAILAGVLLTTAVLYRSNMFDLRPIARSMLIESVMDGMLVVDHEHRIIDCNQAAATLLGRDRKELMGRPAAALLPREFAAMLQSKVHLRSEMLVRRGDGDSWFEVDVTPLEVRRRAAGYLLVARDISERRLAQQALEESRRALEVANARLVEQSVTDPLTGLKNRRFLFQRLNEELNRHHRSGAVLGLLVVDLDHFKSVNDTHGHPEGDEVLIQVAAALTSTVRDCDVVARLGGEEFAVLAVSTDGPGLLSLAERIRKAIGSISAAPDTDAAMALTASIGLSFAGPDTRSSEGLFAEADRNLYRAKHQGRNRVVATTPPVSVEQAG